MTSLYQVSIPVFIRILTNLSALLDKGAAHAEAKKYDPSVLVNARLAPDMFPLARQIQVASDSAKGLAARLAGVEVPSWPDDEKTIADLQARIAKTIDYLKGFKPEQIDGQEDRTVTMKAGPNEYSFKGIDFLLGFAIPNLFFHVTTAYNILRHNGVEVGKMDFLGKVI
jgi:uncharacterized protein